MIGDGRVVGVPHAYFEVGEVPKKDLPKSDIPFIERKRILKIAVACGGVDVKAGGR